LKEYRHRTDTLNSGKVVIVGKQKRRWVEFQLLDEQGAPLANMPYRAMNEATRTGLVPEFSGQSNEQGIIRLEDLHPLPVTLLMQADPFAEALQGRRLRAARAEPPRPGVGDSTDLYGPQRSGFSPLEKQAHESGHHYHYLRIGQLCDGLPTLEPELPHDEELPKYHFPDPNFKGFTVEYEQLSCRHVLEVCPFRAWSLLLHHQAEYSLVNAYNLGLMSILSYSTVQKDKFGSPRHLFLTQCLDLSRSPKVPDGGAVWPCVVIDVPFTQRYTVAEALDTSEVESPLGDTQLFYAVGFAHVLVSWRGTASGQDALTDLMFRPVDPTLVAGCDDAIPCKDLTSVGKVHFGFRKAFDVAKEIFVREFEGVIAEAAKGKEFFICGHSLGGALGLIHSADMRESYPLLYTYGMPRTFSLRAVKELGEIVHFRHVNDMDPIPSVPPEVDLDNHLYELYGPLGGTLGFTWSLAQWTASNLVSLGDPFAHHGHICAFYKATQHIQERGSNFPAYRSKEGLGAPYYTIVSRRLPVRVKLHLVPSLSLEEDQRAEEKQKEFTSKLSSKSLSQYFPKYGNVKKGRLLKGFDHFMVEYQPHLHNQLLESMSSERMRHRKSYRDEFEEQMATHYSRIHPAELDRNRAFLELQRMVDRSLNVSKRAEGGVEALQRFDAVANTEAFHERITG